VTLKTFACLGVLLATTSFVDVAHAKTRPAAPVATPAAKQLPPRTTRHVVNVPALGGPFYYLAWRAPGVKAKGRYPLLVMLHGLGGDPYGFFELGDMGNRLEKAVRSGKLPPCVAVIPEGRNGYWSNWVDGNNPYADLVTAHIVPAARSVLPVTRKASSTVIMGLSMGGFGALSIGLRHPRTFGIIVALSPTDMEYAVQGSPRRKVYTNAFGLPIQMAAVRSANPFHLVKSGCGRGQTVLLSYGAREGRKFKQGTIRLAKVMRKAKMRVRVQSVAGGVHGWASTWKQSHPWWIPRVGTMLKKAR